MSIPVRAFGASGSVALLFVFLAGCAEQGVVPAGAALDKSRTCSAAAADRLGIDPSVIRTLPAEPAPGGEFTVFGQAEPPSGAELFFQCRFSDSGALRDVVLR